MKLDELLIDLRLSDKITCCRDSGLTEEEIRDGKICRKCERIREIGRQVAGLQD